MLKKTKSFTIAHDNGDHFAIIYDHASGHPNRYTVLVWRNGKKAKIIGREVDYVFAEKLVRFYPKLPTI